MDWLGLHSVALICVLVGAATILATLIAGRRKSLRNDVFPGRMPISQPAQKNAPPAAEDRVVRVFISSTFQDMQGERDVLVRQVFPALRARFRPRGVELIETDLRWGITREQAEQGEILPICLREIDRCRPYFIGLIGARYGWIPPKDAIGDSLIAAFPTLKGATGRSVTELEILHGVLQNEEPPPNAVFFLRETDEKSQEGARASAKLAALKRRIRQSGAAVRAYSRTDELGPAVERILGEWVEARFPESAPADRYTEVLRLHAAYARERRTFHIGAEPYRNALDAWVELDGAPPVLIRGASGGGKSTLIANWIAAYRARRPADAVFEHYLGASPESADPELLIRRLWVFLDLASGEDVRPAGADPGLAELAAELPARVAHAAAAVERRGGRILIALDGLDKLSAAEDLRWLPDALPPSVRMLVSALEGPALAAAEERGFHGLDVRPLTEEERSLFVARTLQTWGRDLSVDRSSRIIAHPLSSNPLFLKIILDELRYSATEARLDERIGLYLDAPDLPNLFARVLARLESDCGDEFVRAALGLVWAGRAGLEESEIIAATHATPLDWAKLRNGLNDALREQDGRVTFSHDYLRQAVERRYLPEPEIQRAARVKVADQFALREADDRQAEELPYQLRAAEEWDRLEAILLDLDRFALYRDARGSVEILGYWRALAPFGRDPESLLIGAFEARVAEPPSEQDLIVGATLSEFLFECGARGEASERLARRISAAISAVLGPEENASIDVAARLALLVRARGDLAEARKIESELLDIRRRTLGEEHDSTLSAMNNLGLTLESLGDAAGAQALQERVLELRLRSLGEHHPNTIKSMSNLALTVRAQGHYQSARELHERAYAAFKRTAGADDPDTLHAAANLARTLYLCGDLAGARKLLEQTHDASARVLGPEHPDTLIVLSELAQSLQADGENEAAKAMNERCLEISIKRLGPGHPDTLTSMSNLAAVLDDMGDFDRALELQVRVVEGNERDFGADHPDTLASKNNLAMIRHHAGDLRAAFDLLSEVGEARTRTLGPDHPMTLSTIANLGSLCVDAEDFDTARILQEHVIAANARVLGPDHPDTLHVMSNFVFTCFRAGDYQTARKIAESVFEARTQRFGSEHKETRSAMADFGIMLKETGDDAQARLVLERLQEIQRRVLEPDDPEVVALVDTLAAFDVPPDSGTEPEA